MAHNERDEKKDGTKGNAGSPDGQGFDVMQKAVAGPGIRAGK